MTDGDLRARAEKWIHDDPSEATRDELAKLLARADDPKALTDLRERFSGPLEFGTAGLRGVLGAGESRMNRAVVLRTTNGLGKCVLKYVQNAPSVVIGFDGRRLSREFAEDTACALAALGIRAYLFHRVAPTPVTSFAVKHLGAAAGVMVTASHNPPEYNGYKVYWENSAQIIPPIDAEIAREIAAAPPGKDVPRMPLDDARKAGLVIESIDGSAEGGTSRMSIDGSAEGGTSRMSIDGSAEGGTSRMLIDGSAEGGTSRMSIDGSAEGGTSRMSIDDAIARAYYDAIEALRFGASSRRDLRIVYTAMHGVGDAFARHALARAGFTDVFSVPEQAEPDGEFPTVAFPNPEEKGAMDLSFAHARARNAELVLANDPDADRLAVAIPDAKSASKYMQLTGNQVGVLLGHHLIARGPKIKNPLMLASIVSSPELGNIARALGVRFEETLTGFKWIANRAMDLERTEGLAFVFGYEEALGYTVGDVVRDKDGVSAAVMFADLVAHLASEGRTVHDELAAIARKFGLWVSGQINVVRKGSAGPAEITAMMDRIRASSPKTLGPFTVARKDDFAAGARGLPKTNMIAFELESAEGASRVIARPSGTEPKAKFYFDVSDRIAENATLDAADARARSRMKQLQDAFVALAGTG